ncbi:uncharacterized protein F4822DRAFT_304325 [Hypoxylon trugodes]|uniref:uncharacterized protein n=1 Tax=Hypoxylon trugodes TaxID=326681 RepID=UPI00218E6040|nr:uncharacterized protein F4822DRAFT_304325 [Hypoxylon trugodes]KAI1386054.1 hypothetical protein F4822DRAFT_304325 [Hypoxylon trugodes]
MPPKNDKNNDKNKTNKSPREPPASDLPGLLPRHDGSYGVNSLINIDSVGSKNKKNKTGLIREDDEDRRFTRKVLGKDGKRFGMEKDLKKVVKETVIEAGKGDKSQPEDPKNKDPPSEKPKDFGSDSSRSSDPSIKSSNDSSDNSSVDDESEDESDEKKEGEPNNQQYLAGSLNDLWESAYGEGPVHEPTLSKLGRFFTGGPTWQRQPKPVHKPVQHRSPNPESLIHDRLASVPPTSTPKSFFGSLSGYGSLLESAARPDSRRSYIEEGNIYGGSGVHTPVPTIGKLPKAGNRGGASTGNARGGRQGDKGKSIIGQGTDGDETADTSLTPSQLQKMNNLIDGMITSERPSITEEIPPETVADLKKLTPAQIQALRFTAGDMINDPTRASQTREILDELPQQAQQPPKTSVITLFDSGNESSDDDIPKKHPLIGTILTEKRANEKSSKAKVPSSKPGAKWPPSGVAPVGPKPSGGAKTKILIDESTDDSVGDAVKSATKIPPRRPGSSEHKATLPVSAKSVSQNYPDDYSSSDTSDTKSSPFSRQRHHVRPLWGAGNQRVWQSTCFVFLGLLTASWVLLSVIYGGSVDSPVRTRPAAGSGWFNLGSLGQGLRQIIPTGIGNPIPQITWGSGKSKESPASLVESIITEIPEQVYVDVDKKGKPKISQDFWHALRNLIRGDDAILTLDNTGSGTQSISEAHWRAIRQRLSEDGFLPGTTSDAGKTSQAAQPQAWEAWEAQNRDNLKKMIGGIVLTRDEFKKLFDTEVKNYQKDIRKEIGIQNSRIKDLAAAIAKLQSSGGSKLQGLTEKEVKAIGDAAIARAIKNAKIDAVASGAIRSHANDMFTNQINFFSVGSGAVIDPKYTSNTWHIPTDSVKHHRSRAWYQRDGYKPQPPLAGLSAWEEEGECFCAEPSNHSHSKESNSIAVMLSRDITPQHLVVEHILPGSTLDPGAIPKEIEVWAYIEEVTLRDEIRAFSLSQFPETSAQVAGIKGKVTLNEGFIKIGHFTYQRLDHGDGIQIFKLSDEIARMHATTDHIVVRAISNYGADHTCFYRLRIYGDVVDVSRPWEEWGFKDE